MYAPKLLQSPQQPPIYPPVASRSSPVTTRLPATRYRHRCAPLGGRVVVRPAVHIHTSPPTPAAQWRRGLAPTARRRRCLMLTVWRRCHHPPTPLACQCEHTAAAAHARPHRRGAHHRRAGPMSERSLPPPRSSAASDVPPPPLPPHVVSWLWALKWFEYVVDCRGLGL
jgi:hypothetical protein